MNIGACIQARMNSERLPGKVLVNIEGKPMLQWQIERLKKSKLINNIYVATTTSIKDDPIEILCKKLGVKVYRGSENNVLKRVCELLRKFNVDIHVECFGDSPMVDPQLIDKFLDYFLKHHKDIDFLSSSLESSYPAGLEVSIYKSEVLFEVDKSLKENDSFREHVGFNITRKPNIYRLFSLVAPEDLRRPDIYLEVDTKKDLYFIKKIFQHFSKKKKNKFFGTKEIIDFLNRNPHLIKINQQEERRWKILRERNLNLN